MEVRAAGLAVCSVRAAVRLFIAFKHNVYLLSTGEKRSVNEGATWEMLCVCVCSGGNHGNVKLLVQTRQEVRSSRVWTVFMWDVAVCMYTK